MPAVLCNTYICTYVVSTRNSLGIIWAQKLKITSFGDLKHFYITTTLHNLGTSLVLRQAVMITFMISVLLSFIIFQNDENRFLYLSLPYIVIILKNDTINSNMPQCLSYSSCTVGNHSTHFWYHNMWTTIQWQFQKSKWTKKQNCLFISQLVCVWYMQVEKEIFDKMDNLFNTGQGDGEYKELFIDMWVVSVSCDIC